MMINPTNYDTMQQYASADMVKSVNPEESLPVENSETRISEPSPAERVYKSAVSETYNSKEPDESSSLPPQDPALNKAREGSLIDFLV